MACAILELKVPGLLRASARQRRTAVKVATPPTTAAAAVAPAATLKVVVWRSWLKVMLCQKLGKSGIVMLTSKILRLAGVVELASSTKFVSGLMVMEFPA